MLSYMETLGFYVHYEQYCFKASKDGGEALKSKCKSQLHFKWNERHITIHDISENSASYREIHG